ncbi:unnamed protein product, partial [Ixodes pacificus]
MALCSSSSFWSLAARAAASRVTCRSPARCVSRASSGTPHSGQRSLRSSAVYCAAGSLGWRSSSVSPLKGSGAMTCASPRSGRGCSSQACRDAQPTVHRRSAPSMLSRWLVTVAGSGGRG